VPQVTIENPILNSPYVEPSRHFRFSDEGMAAEVDADGRIGLQSAATTCEAPACHESRVAVARA
jgi:hypothetical protein